MGSRLSSELKNLLVEHEETLQIVARQLKSQWKSERIKRENEFETIYTLGNIEGMCDGVDVFLKELEKIASSE